MNKINVVLDKGARMPEKAHEADAGFDLFAIEGAVIDAKDCAVFDTGVHIEIPKGYVGFLKSKSGLNVKHSIISDGTIDSGYTGSIKVKLYNLGGREYTVHAGDKITQLVIQPIGSFALEATDRLEASERGDNGFGSSGK